MQNNEIQDELIKEDGFYDEKDKWFVFSILDRNWKRFFKFDKQNVIFNKREYNIGDFITENKEMSLKWYR